ncbi:MAG: associated Golgi protein-related protein [Frankiales bacterium]|nr:associated Golgi protein-related protein [Frankiales bacterium]
MVERVVEGLLAVPAPLAYTLVALLVFGEAAVFVGFVLPGETAVVLGGVLAASGRLSLPVLLVVVVVSAVLGDSVGYEVGRRFGPRLLALGLLRTHASRLEGAQRFLRERGGVAVLLGRFTAFLRAVVPGLAGLSGMPYRRFLVWNAVGGVVWGGGFTLLGYLAGDSYQRLEKGVGRGSAALTALLVVAGVVVWHRTRRQAEEAVEPDGEQTPT